MGTGDSAPDSRPPAGGCPGPTRSIIKPGSRLINSHSYGMSCGAAPPPNPHRGRVRPKQPEHRQGRTPAPAGLLSPRCHRHPGRVIPCQAARDPLARCYRTGICLRAAAQNPFGRYRRSAEPVGLVVETASQQRRCHRRVLGLQEPNKAVSVRGRRANSAGKHRRSSTPRHRAFGQCTPLQQQRSYSPQPAPHTPTARLRCWHPTPRS